MQESDRVEVEQRYLTLIAKIKTIMQNLVVTIPKTWQVLIRLVEVYNVSKSNPLSSVVTKIDLPTFSIHYNE